MFAFWDAEGLPRPRHNTSASRFAFSDVEGDLEGGRFLSPVFVSKVFSDSLTPE